MTRWQRYWFADGGRYAAAFVRVALALSVLLTLSRIATLAELPGAHTLYRPVGIWMLLGHHVPPEWLIGALWNVAWVATALMLVGLWTRTATAVSFAAASSLAALSFASSASWSHQYNVVFLAQLAFLGARGGDVLSIDWLIRRGRGLPAHDVPRGYQWSLRLVQLAVALMFSGAVFHKLLHGHFTLRWALSDNLRHQLLVRFDLAGLERAPLVDWLIDDVWRYRTAALLNMISQATPIAAVIWVTRPWIRALGGVFFVVEVCALSLVVGLWNPHWLPLAAVFVDWDRLLRVAPPPARVIAPPSTGKRWFVLAFVLYDAFTAFVPTVDQTLNTFPFSGFPMFATVRASAPYSGHAPYRVAADHFAVDHPIPDYAQRWLDHANRDVERITDPERLHRKMVTILDNVRGRYPDANIHTLTLWLTVFEAPAYPARAHFEPHPIAVMARISDDGRYESLLGTKAVPDVFFVDDDPSPRTTRDDGNPIYDVATRDGTPWLVSVERHWQWN